MFDVSSNFLDFSAPVLIGNERKLSTATCVTQTFKLSCLSLAKGLQIFQSSHKTIKNRHLKPDIRVPHFLIHYSYAG